MLRLCFLVLFGSIGFGIIAPYPSSRTNKPRQIPTVKALEFMKKFGYIQKDNGHSEALYTEEGLSKIIKVMQRFGGIDETGVFDKSTEKLMTLPRCGVPDIIKQNRAKRFVLGSTGWQKRNISYFIANWSPKLGEAVVNKHIQTALNQWGGYGRLNFFKKNNQDADIIFQFASGLHGDSFPFDGSGRTLAHAFYPYEFSSLSGDIHFDADEDWIDNVNKKKVDGTDFYFVVLHELGHSLGLDHSFSKNSIMFPYYQNPDENSIPQLGYDDILAMYDLYIRRPLKDDNGESSAAAPTTSTESFTKWFSTTEKDTSSTEKYSTVTYTGDTETVEEHKNHDKKHHLPSNATSPPDICDGQLDTIASLRDELFVFRDTYIWRFRDRGELVKGYPVKLNTMFPTLPESVKKIDAAYQRPDGSILLFTGNKFWIHNGENFLSGSPESLTHLGLPEYITKLDAVQNWHKNGKTYFYAMDRFWRYNETSREIDPGYPQSMQRWRRVPSYLDAATTWKDGYTYFFRGGLFWKFDNNWIMVTDESPMPTPTYWFGCPEKNNVIMNWFLESS